MIQKPSVTAGTLLSALERASSIVIRHLPFELAYRGKALGCATSS
jgi:hypothetical protein